MAPGINSWLAACAVGLLAAAGTKPDLRLAIVPAFGAATFSKPLFVTWAPDGKGRIFVVEQGGRIWAMDVAARTKTLFLDLSKKTHAQGEMGLLGLAFHPRFRDNGFFYVYYSAIGPRRPREDRHDNVVARFSVSKDGRVDLDSERVLLRVNQLYGNHNGGCIAFGSDGYLYISKGDGGSGGDPHRNGQSLGVLLGKILRIDVDHPAEGKEYGIPRDNPFAGKPDARPEIWAYGLRNPWRFSFDRKTGELWAGDVGQNEVEEIDLIEKGKNYGWNYYEGTSRFRKDAPPPERFQMPVVEYRQGPDTGRCIIGGYVYRGRKNPGLQGAYLYGDYLSGRVWGLRYSKGSVGEKRELLAAGVPITSFGEDEDGEVYLTAFDGKVYRVGSAGKAGR